VIWREFQDEAASSFFRTLLRLEEAFRVGCCGWLTTTPRGFVDSVMAGVVGVLDCPAIPLKTDTLYGELGGKAFVAL
jgi:hypothetical protein